MQAKDKKDKLSSLIQQVEVQPLESWETYENRVREVAKNQTVDMLKQTLKSFGFKSSFGKMRKDELITTLINLKEKDFKVKAAN